MCRNDKKPSPVEDDFLKKTLSSAGIIRIRFNGRIHSTTCKNPSQPGLSELPTGVSLVLLYWYS